MNRLTSISWESIYESQPRESGSHLVTDFYIPALERSICYDRIAGYFSSSALAVASRGIDALVENDGKMRLIVGTELYETDRPVLEALTDELSESLEDLDDEQLDAQLQLLAHYLREDRLHIKVAVPREGNWRIFHPKVGIFHDEDENALSFEGSINETIGGWRENYERFKVHRSWVDDQRSYVQGDIDTFDQLWNDEHPYVEVYDLPDAIEQDLIDWKAPDSESQVEEAIQIVRGDAPPTEKDKANVIADGPLSPGGLALAEEGSTITPWPHQRVVSDTLVNTYPNSFLLCDEVGLGKTIEAGLTLSRLGLSEELETGLLLVPASLQIQWQEELWEKFNLNAYRFDRGSNYEYAFIDAFDYEHELPTAADLNLDADQLDEAWVESPIWRFLHAQQSDNEAIDPPTIVIMSWHTARLENRWNQVAPSEDGVVRTQDDVPASCRGRSTGNREGVWDAVVVDEAHNARKGSNFYTLLDRLRDHTQTYYLLTATPMQLHSGELYDLMALLDLPGDWDDQDQFVQFFETRRSLSQVLRAGFDGEAESSNDSWSAQATLEENRYQDRLPTDRSVSDRILDALGAELDLGDNENQARAMAKERVLNACDLAANYGEHYDGYVELFRAAIRNHSIEYDVKEDEKLKFLLYPDWKADEEWLTFSRNERREALDELSEEGWRVVQKLLAKSTPVDALIHRNTRDTLRKYELADLLDETVPTRNPEQRQIELTDETRQVYDRIHEYTSKFYKLAQQSSDTETRAIGFVMTTYRQRLTSSVYAISKSLQRRLEKLKRQRTILEGKRRASERSYGESQQVILDTLSEYDLDDMDEIDELEGDLEDANLAEIIPSVTDEGIDLLKEEIEELESFVSDLTRIDEDPKINQLVDDLDILDKQGHNRVIVFTQYTDTMDFIRDNIVSIHGTTVATYSGRGGEMYDAETGTWTEVGKERVKRSFAADGGQVDILVCTDSASEGLNLQECGALINYDLPWNPMRVEQRIGRIDRIGQHYDEVTILNYSYADTVETDIYDRLDDRIGLFETVVGEMQPILSSVNEQIRSATLEADPDESREAVERADRQLSEKLEAQEEDDRVDVGESLETVETPVAQEVIEQAKLDAWKSFRHPDISESETEGYEYQPPFKSRGLEAILVGNETLAEAGVAFTSIDELAVEQDDGEFSGKLEHEEDMYRLTISGTELPLFTAPGEGTVAEAIAPTEDSIAVTFSADCAEKFSSVHLLAPGNPLLPQLLATLRAKSNASERLQSEQVYRDDSRVRSLARAQQNNEGTLVRVTDSGTIEKNEPTLSLDAWVDAFLTNRKQASNTEI